MPCNHRWLSVSSLLLLACAVRGQPPVISQAEHVFGWGNVNAIAVAPDDSFLAIGATSSVVLLDPTTGAELGQLNGHQSYVYSLSINRQGSWLLSTDRDSGPIRLWDLRRGFSQNTDCCGLGAGMAEFLKDGNHFVTTYDGTIRRTRDRAITKDLGGPLWADAIAVSESDSILVSGGGPACCPSTILFDREGQRRELAFRSDDCGDYEYNIKLRVSGAALSADGSMAAIFGISDCGGGRWNTATGQFLGHENCQLTGAFLPGTSTIRCFYEVGALSADGTRAFQGGTSARVNPKLQPSLAQYDVATGALIKNYSPPGHTDIVYSGTFSPDGLYILTGGRDDQVIVWDRHAHTEIRHLVGHTKPVRCVRVSPDSTRALSVGDDGNARLWQLGTGQLERTIPVSSVLLSCSFSPDGSLIAIGSQSGVDVYATDSGLKVRHLAPGYSTARSVAFSHSGTLLAAGGSDNQLYLWNTSTWQLAHVCEGHNVSISSVDFSPDDAVIASAADHRYVRIWNPQTGTLVRTLDVGAPLRGISYVASVSFSTDGRWLLIGGFWSPVGQIWDTTSWNPVRFIIGHTKEIESATLSPDGKHLLNTSRDATARLYFSADCNGNGIDDTAEITGGSVQDCNGNWTPDACESDRDSDGVIDQCDVCPDTVDATQTDTDNDGVGDACDACPNTIPLAVVDVHGCTTPFAWDFDRDGDVDGNDVEVFAACATRAMVTERPAGCTEAAFTAADADDDGDVDQSDFASLQRCISGTNTQYQMNCER